MNWTGGRLQRHSKSAGGGVANRQKQHFAKVRSQLQNGSRPGQTPFTPSFLQGDDGRLCGRLPLFTERSSRHVGHRRRSHGSHGRAARDQADDGCDGEGSGRVEEITSSRAGPLIRVTEDTGANENRVTKRPASRMLIDDETLEAKRKELLTRRDWLGLDEIRPVRMQFQSHTEKQMIGKRRKTSATHQRSLFTQKVNTFLQPRLEFQEGQGILNQVAAPQALVDHLRVRIGTDAFLSQQSSTQLRDPLPRADSNEEMLFNTTRNRDTIAVEGPPSPRLAYQHKLAGTSQQTRQGTTFDFENVLSPTHADGIEGVEEAEHAQRHSSKVIGEMASQQAQHGTAFEYEKPQFITGAEGIDDSDDSENGGVMQDATSQQARHGTAFDYESVSAATRVDEANSSEGGENRDQHTIAMEEVDVQQDLEYESATFGQTFGQDNVIVESPTHRRQLPQDYGRLIFPSPYPPSSQRTQPGARDSTSGHAKNVTAPKSAETLTQRKGDPEQGSREVKIDDELAWREVWGPSIIGAEDGQLSTSDTAETAVLHEAEPSIGDLRDAMRGPVNTTSNVPDHERWERARKVYDNIKQKKTTYGKTARGSPAKKQTKGQEADDGDALWKDFILADANDSSSASSRRHEANAITPAHSASRTSMKAQYSPTTVPARIASSNFAAPGSAAGAPRLLNTQTRSRGDENEFPPAGAHAESDSKGRNVMLIASPVASEAAYSNIRPSNYANSEVSSRPAAKRTRGN